MSTKIEADDLKLFAKGKLAVPERVISHQPVDEDQRQSAAAALVPEREAAARDEWHCRVP